MVAGSNPAQISKYFELFTIFIGGGGGGVKKHLLKNKIICNCIRSQLLQFLCYFNLPA